MKHYVWRKTILILFAWFCTLFGILIGFISILNPHALPEPPYVTVGFIVIGMITFVSITRLGLSHAKFIELLRNNGFEIADKKGSLVLGMTNDSILFRGYLSGRYAFITTDLPLSPSSSFTAGSSLNLRFYFPCKRVPEFNHYIVKYGSKLKIGYPFSFFRSDPDMEVAKADLSKIIADSCDDKDFLYINNLYSRKGFMCIATGPASLSYGAYLKKNIPSVLKFIKAFRAYYACQDEKWERQIDMDNLIENIQIME